MAIAQHQSEKSHFRRFIQGSDDQNKLVDSMGKLTRFVNLLQVCRRFIVSLSVYISDSASSSKF